MNRSNNINRINSVLFGALKYIIFIFLLVILFNIITVINLNAQSSREQELAELSRLEAEAKEHELVIKEKQKEQVTIVRDITIIDTKIKKTNTEIVIADKNIKGLDYSITDKNKKIKSVAEKIDDNRDNIYSILRQLSYVSNDSINLSFLSNGTISDVIDNIYSNQSLQKRLYITLQEYQDNKKILEEVKEALLTDKEKEQQYKNKQAELKREAELNKSSKNQILKVTKGEEIKYKQLLADSQKKIAQLRARLFPLNNANQKINFGEALDYAKQAQRVTGVRPAFVLAILTQESGLGANVGTCYLSDKESGVGYNIKTQKSFTNVMSPKRDIKEFINITSNLGLDPLKTPVSCPIASAGGWGGAMGPSQFIPSTWNAYKNKIANAIGVGEANPWSPRDAIFGTSFLSKSNGAIAYDYNSEKNAACRYYSGRSCSASSHINGYGANVMALVNKVQADIDTIERVI